MAQNSPASALNDLLTTRNFEVELFDASTGRPPVDPEGRPDTNKADLFQFDYVSGSGKNYGTVNILLGAENNLLVSSGDNTGRSMEADDKSEWFQFLQQLKTFATRNLLRFDVENPNRLKFTMKGMANIKEGLFESLMGNKKFSYSGPPTEARLRIEHSRPIGENDARFRHIKNMFIETAEGEVFRMPFRKLAGGRAMLEHVRQGGTPYDIRGQHIKEMVEQINVLGQFRRAHQGKVFEGAADQLIQETNQYYENLKHGLGAMSKPAGYARYFESWSPADITEQDMVVEDLKGLFVETRIDPRIERALPVLSQINSTMKEAQIFEQWATKLTEGTWAIADTPEAMDRLKMLLSKPRPVGPDAEITQDLYDLIGDDRLFDELQQLAQENPDADAVPVIQAWINSHMDYPDVAALADAIAIGTETTNDPDTDAEIVPDGKVAEGDNLSTPLEEKEPEESYSPGGIGFFSESVNLARLKTLAFPKQS